MGNQRFVDFLVGLMAMTIILIPPVHRMLSDKCAPRPVHVASDRLRVMHDTPEQDNPSIAEAKTFSCWLNMSGDVIVVRTTIARLFLIPS